MTVYTATPPVEVDVKAVPPTGGDPSELFETSLAAHVRHCWNRAKFAKQEHQERLLRCERQRRGVYDPERALEIARTGGSDIYMMITDIKCRAAEAWIRDVMLSQSDRVFALDPSEDPKVPPEIKLGIVDMVKQEAMQYLQSGAQIHPDTFRVRMTQVHDAIMDKLRQEAKDSAGRMEDKIDDQLHTGKFYESLKDFVNDFVTYPTAIMKGPTVRRRKRLEWGPEFTPIVITDLAREFERVSPFDFYPSPNASSVDNAGYVIQRHRLSRGDLESLMGVPGYSDENIEQVLIRFGDKGLREWLMGDQERDNLEGKPHSRIYNEEVIEGIEYWGKISGRMLLEFGAKKKDIDEFKEYEANVWQIGPFVIKAVLNPDPLGKRPYDIASWEEIPGSVWGLALPEIMRDTQIMCNAAARALANNMGVASGPQVEVSVDRLPDGEDVTNLYPWKIWQTTSDRTGGGQSAIRFFQPSMNADVLMGVYQSFSRQADEVTGIPNYVYGSSAVAGAGRTASGLSMLMDNAAKGIKQAIVNIDHVVAAVVKRLYIHNMMYDDDIYAKGDFTVTSKGAMGLVQREQLQIRRNEFLQATANQLDMQIIGMDGRAYLLREIAKTLQMETDKLVPNPEVIKALQEQQAMLQAAQQAAMQQPQAGQGQLPAPTTTDAAGNPAGGVDANLMQQRAG